jgi:hypothetical protein
MLQFRPRFSLGNLLLVMTCIALATALWQTRKRIGVIRAEVWRLQVELVEGAVVNK